MDAESEILRYIGKWKSYQTFGKDISDGLKQVLLLNSFMDTKCHVFFPLKIIEFKFMDIIYTGFILLAWNGSSRTGHRMYSSCTSF